MKRCLILAVAALLLIVAQCAVVAVAPDNPTKWSQLPDMNLGLDFSSETKVPSIVADDWKCLNGLPVTDIHWWGSYWLIPPQGGFSPNSDSLPNAGFGDIEAFVLKIYSDVPASPTAPITFSHPGTELWSWQAAVQECHETLFGVTNGGQNVYQYYFSIPERIWFPQEKDTIYWLSIQAVMPDTGRQWGWHESKDHYYDDAVQDFQNSGWYALENNLYSNDMAFELTTVPEPGTVLALGSALTGLAFLMSRRRRT